MPSADPSMTAETSLLLREILQNKDKLHQRSDKEIRETMQDCSTAPIIEETAPGRTGSDLNDLNDADSERSDRRSLTGSDADNFLEHSQLDDGEGDDSKSDVDENGFSDTNSPSSGTKEAKRARVENIITSMQNVPSYSDHEAGLSEIRRQKRKQYLPQQHEGNAKLRRIDNNNFEEMWQLRNQLQAVESYRKHFDEPSLKPPFNSYCGLDSIQRLHQAYFAGLPTRMPLELQNGHSFESRLGLVKDGHGLEAEGDAPGRKSEQSLGQAASHNGTDSKEGVTSGSEEAEKELQQLITRIKTKVEEAVSSVVDKELAKYFQKQNMKAMEESSSSPPKSNDDTPGKHDEKRPVPDRKTTTDHSLNHILQMPERSVSNGLRLPGRHGLFEPPKLGGPDMPRAQFPHHPGLGFPPPLSYFPTQLQTPLYNSCSIPPEQTEALALVVNTPKKKRTKVTDTRLSPRAARALLQDNASGFVPNGDHERVPVTSYGQILPPGLPTSVAIPNPSLQHSDILSFYKEQALSHSPMDADRITPSSSHSPSDGYGFMKNDYFENSESFDSHGKTIDTLTPMHLRKAKLMFFYVRYPSSPILKVYFPDVQFNKNNTAQLVKWFSNFREFYYIQMEKYARQAIAEGCKHADDLQVTLDSELYRILNLHYNRNNQIEVPEKFRAVVQSTLREFFIALTAAKDSEPSWKKPIYKVIARMDDTLPEYFKSPNWMDQLGDV